MKKFLSMVLALAMAMSLVTFAAPAAGAKDFTDSGSIQYKEAVDVISAIQIMEGYNDASFGPTGTLTRGAAAKIICNMILGPTTASALPTNVAPFPDVPAGSTFAGYIAYCSEHSIISGYADGNFRPADSLSGYAFLKMLLCALGYDQEIEGYQGANWRVNVAKQALGIDLDKGLVGELDGSRIVTREEAALYAFNTLQADMVEYGNKTTVAVNGATVTVGANSAQAKTASTQRTQDTHIDAQGFNGQQIVQFGEEYFPQLIRVPRKNEGFTGEGDDDFGRPTTRWTYKGVEIGKYPSSLALTYYGDKKVSEIYADLGLGGTAENAEVWMNGYHVFDIDISRSKDTAIHELKDADTIKYALAGGGVQDSNMTYLDSNGEFGRREVILDQGEVTDGDGHPIYAKTIGGANVLVDANGEQYDVTNPTAAAVPATDKQVYFFNRNGLAYYSDKMGDADILEVYYDEDSNSVVLVGMSVYPGEIGSVNATTSAKDAYVTVDYLDGTNTDDAQSAMGASANYGKKNNTENEYTTNASFAEEDVVWFTFSAREDSIGSVGKMESLEGTLNRSNSDAVTIDGKAYDYAEEHRFDMSNGAADLSNNSSYVIYLANGKVLWMKEAEFSAEFYALVERISAEDDTGSNVYFSGLENDGTPNLDTMGSSWDSNKVRLLLSNGTVRTLDLDGSDRYVDNTAGRIKDEYLAGSIVRYVVNTDGTFRLYSVKESVQGRSLHPVDGATQSGAGIVGTQFTITDKHEMNNLYAYDDSVALGTPLINPVETARYAKKAVSLGTEVSADSSTIFVVKDKDSYKVYNGLRNAPTMNDTNVANSWGDTQAYAYTSGGTNPKAKVVFVIRGSAISSSKDITFLIGHSRSKLYTNSDTDNYYEYTAIVNGQTRVIQVNAEETVPANGGTAFVTTDTEGNALGDKGFYGDVDPSEGDAAWNSVILNRTNYDGDGMLESGEFSSTSLVVGRQIGIKKTSRTDEITLGTYKDENDNQFYTITSNPLCGAIVNATDRTYVLANNCNIFYIDGDDNVSVYTYNQIHNDKDDIVYYTLNDDAEITNLFICDFEA